jgi:tetratricopeptide (TPR) repeat protein
MMTDLLQEDPVDDKGAIAVITDVNDMAEAAQQHVEEGEYDLALVLFGRILNIYRHEYGDVHPLVASAYHNLGMVHSQRAQLLLEGTLQQTHIRQQSLECFQAAARTARDSLGKNHPNVAVSLVKIGFLLLQSRQYQPAVVTFEEALRIRLVHYGNNPHPLVANLHNNLGVCLLHLHSFAESKQHLNMALEIQRHILRVERIKCTREELRVRLLEVADTLSNLGGLGLEWLRQEGPHPEVIEETEGHLAEALEIRTTVLGHEHPLAIQAKTLYEMIRSSMPPPETKSPGRGLQYSIHSNMQPSNPPQMRDIQVLVPSSNTASRDAPAPKFTSASPAVELEGLRRTRDASPVATRTSREVGPSPEPTKSPQSEPSRRTRRDPSPPVTEIVLADEEEPILAQRQSRDQTRVFVSQQYIPRRSPTRRKSGFDESYYSDPKTPVISSPSSESSGRGQLRSHAYDSEESCQLNESGDRVDVLSPFLFQIQNRGDDVEANLSLHEIVVVRPCAKVESDAPCPLVQPLAETMGDDWKGETKKIVSSAPRDNEEDDNDDGIAPLSRTSAINNDPKIHLSSKMMKNPNLHLADIHSVASRYLKVRTWFIFWVKVLPSGLFSYFFGVVVPLDFSAKSFS